MRAMTRAIGGRNPKITIKHFGGVPIMNNLETRRYEMLSRVRDFGAAHKNLFPAKSLAAESLNIIAATVQDLAQHAASQASGIGAAR
jgi:hypothetical protein